VKLGIEGFDEVKIVHRLEIDVASFGYVFVIEEIDFEKRVKLCAEGFDEEKIAY
jgi:hypothetical protein